MEEQRQRQERDWWKIGGIGCLSVIALGAILLAVSSVAVLIAAYSSGGGESVQQQGQDQGQQQAGGRDYLKLSGTAGSARYRKVEDDEGSRSVDTEIPNEIDLTAGRLGVLSVSCQKKQAAGKMVLELYQDGQKVAEGQTTAEYGVVVLDKL